MNITYDRSIELVGLGTVAWTRLGLEKYFDSYQIMSAQAWDIENKYPGLTMTELGVKLEKMQTQAMVSTERFRELASVLSPKSKFIPYKPVILPEWLDASRLIQTDKRFTLSYENKRIFREYFQGLVPFAVFSIRDKTELMSTQEAYAAIADAKPVVIQDESLSGGRGTFVVKNFEQYQHAIDTLHSLSPKGKVVVSEFVSDAVEWSVQCCVTKHGIFIGPAQRQLVRHPALCMPDDPRGDKFCGAQIVHENGLQENIVQKMKEAATIVGNRAKDDGYRGVFGLDFLIKDQQLYLLEMNARMTGVTPLLTMMAGSNDIPFFLLHALELGGFEYHLSGEETLQDGFSRDGSMIILHAHTSKKKKLLDAPRSGVYLWQNGTITFLRSDICLREEDMVSDRLLIQQWAPQATDVEPGGRLLVVYKNGRLIGDDGGLTKEAQEIVDILYKKIELA